MAMTLEEQRDEALRESIRDHHDKSHLSRDAARYEDMAKREPDAAKSQDLRDKAQTLETKSKVVERRCAANDQRYRELDAKVQDQIGAIGNAESREAAWKSDWNRKGEIFLEETGKTKSELTRHNAAVSVSWMERGCIQENKCREPFSVGRMKDWFEGTDFSRPVTVENVNHTLQNRSGGYFSEVGASGEHVGINSSRTHYELREGNGIKMLRGNAAPMTDHFSDRNNIVDTHGGGVQYLPHPEDKAKMPETYKRTAAARPATSKPKTESVT